MEEYNQITLDEWTQWKEDIRRKLAETANNFVYIGYRLKQIRDSGMYDGAADIFEFAEKEYGLGKSTVSRFIAINEKYSEGGNSLELKEKFRGFSSSKLAEMLTLPDSEIQLITEKTTIREIRELKSFNAQGTEEAVGSVHEQERTPLEKCVIDFFKVRKEMLNGVMKHLEADPPEYKQAAEMMAPSGQASHKKGIVFLFLYDWNIGIKYKLMMEQEPVVMSWTEFLNSVYHIFGTCDQTDVWGDFYGKQENTKEEVEKIALVQATQGSASVATSQQEEINEGDTHEKETSESESVKVSEKSAEDVSDVTLTGNAEREDKYLKDEDGQEAAGVENKESGESKAKGEDSADSETDREPATDTESSHNEDGTGGRSRSGSVAGGKDCEGGAEVAPVQPENEKIEGQMSITDFPEYMPDTASDNQETRTETADMKKSGAVIIESDGMRQHIENQKRQITETLHLMNMFCDEENWDKLVELSQEVITRAESIKNMVEAWNG